MTLRAFPIIAAFLLIASFDTVARASRPWAPGQPAIVLEDDPLFIPSISLQIMLPADAIAEPGPENSPIRLRIRPSADDWYVAVQVPDPSAGEANAPRILDEILDRLRKRFGVVRAYTDPATGELREELIETRVRPVERTPNLLVAGRNAERAYVSVPEFSGPDQRFLGYTVVESGPNEHLVFELSSSIEHIAIARTAYETIIASARFIAPEQELTERAKRVSRGVELLSLLDSDTMDLVVQKHAERWERLYIPAGTALDSDDTEVGYRRVRAWRGQRGNLDPARSPTTYDASQREEGYLLSMDVRVLQDGLPVDTRAMYFLSVDGMDEAWNIVMTRREPRGSSTYRETGARHGSSLKIHTEGTGQPPNVIRPIFSSEGYLSQIHAFLLPSILVQLNTPGEYAFYAYRTVDQKVRVREDTLAEVPGRPGVLSLTTIFHEDEPPQITLLRSDASLIRTTLPGGRVWEPTTLDELVALWKRKGLPLN